MTKRTNNLKGSLLLTLAAIIWGSAFVAQEEAAQFIGAFSVILTVKSFYWLKSGAFYWQ